METKTKVVIGLMLFAIIFCAGRFSAPEKVRTEVKTIEIEKKQTQTDTDRQKHQDTVTTTVKAPDGTVTTRTETKTDTNTEQKKNQVVDTKTDTDSVKEVTRNSAPVTISALGGMEFGSGLVPVYGLSATKPILGPIAVGIWGLSDLSAGLSLGLTF